MLFQKQNKQRIKKTLQVNEISNPIDIGVIDKCIRKTGCYIVLVRSEEEDGPNGIYCISKSDKDLNGYISKIACSNGIGGDSIDIEWKPQCFPRVILHYCNNTQSTKDKVIFSYKIKVIDC